MFRRAIPIVLAVLTAGPAAAAPETIAKAGDASIARNRSAETWSISAGGATLTLALGATRDFQVVALSTQSNRSWTLEERPDTSVIIDGTSMAVGKRAAGFVYQSATAAAHDEALTLDAVFDHQRSGLRITRHYRVTNGSPAFEVWNTYATINGKSVAVTDLSVLELSVANNTIRWLTGLQGDNAGEPRDTAFTLQQKQLDVKEEFSFGSEGRSSEQAVPWFAVDGSDTEEFYAALMWSGAWSFTAYRPGGTMALSLGLTGMTTNVSAPVDGPHALFGIVRGGLPQATGAMRSYWLDGMRSGRPLTPLVTYNTWFAYGTEFDDHDIYREMDLAAALGAELFVVDAGWYVGAGATGRWDFESGVGSWEADPARFPDGLRALRDHAHDVGLKFGLWVEPERISLDLLGDESSAREAWLATSNGQYGSERSALVCLANTAARSWIFTRLAQLVDEVAPDYLKWDNNLWLNCNRAGHEHGPNDGNFAQVTGLYALLQQLRDRYPELLVENVSGGGNRLDFGMLRYTDAGWMDDRTAPSVHVRHIVQGLSTVFPPAYLLSFLTQHADERLHAANDLSLYVRSRMQGAFGLGFRSGDLSDDGIEKLSREIALYKQIRATISIASGALLTPQAAAETGPDWDVLQETDPDGANLVLCAFQSNDAVDRFTVKPTGLNPSATYQVWSADLGPLGTATGAELMANGIELIESPDTAAHIIVLRAQ
jgi:alpha-galactosidase